MNRTVQFATILLVAVVTIGFSAPVAGIGAAGDGVVHSSDDVEIDTVLEAADGEVEVIVRLEEADGAVVQAEGFDALQEHALATQGEVESFAQSHPGIEIVNQFWITNALVLNVDTDTVDLNDIAQLDVVEELHANFTVQIPEEPEVANTAPESVQTQDWQTTYGLAQINAPTVWDQFGTQGSGAKIAVLDTGVDVSHPDLDLYTEDADDPTYPGGWAQIDGDGDVVEGSEPHDSGQHGTHVQGSVAGGDASGEWIGVAPEADLMHGLVLDGGSGTWAQIIGGMEWAVQNDADAISMSLGADGYHDQFVDPIQNAMDAGVVVISAAGNSGAGTTGSPGNLYDGMGIGASDEDENIADFSSGEEIETDDAWGDAPDHWPEQYIVPDVSAPGAAVVSSVPGDDYAAFSGTSMATPHVSGVVALMVSANPDLEPDQIEQALVDSAWKPDGEDDEQDIRYGHGIIDAQAAVEAVAMDTGIEGTVVSEGEPVANANVELDGVASTTTDANGEFAIVSEPGTYDLSISGPGIESTTETVTVEDGDERTDVGAIEVAPALHAEVVDDQPEAIEAGDTVNVTIDAMNLELFVIGMEGEYDQKSTDLYINDQQVDFDTIYDLGGFSGELVVSVDTSEDVTGEFGLVFGAAGLGDEVELTSGPTQVVDELQEVGLVGSFFLDEIQETLEGQLPSTAQFQGVDSVDAVGDHDVYVVQDLANIDSDAFVEATSSPDVGVVYLDQWSTESHGIPDFADVSTDVTDTFEDDNFFGDVQDPIYYEAVEDHEILAGVDVGEEVLIHDGEFGDVTWFESSFQDLATVNDEAGVIGSGLAIDEETGTVLASSLGYTEFVNHPQYSDAADEILGNAVSYFFADDGEEPGEGDFAVDDIDAQPIASPGEEIQVLGAIANYGDDAGTTTATLTIAGEEQSSQEVTLDPMEWESVAFLGTVPSQPGTYEVEVSTPDDSLSQEIVVEGDVGEVTLDLGDATGAPGGSATVDLEAHGSDIAGYEALIGFDPNVVQFADVSGVDFEDPEVNVDNDNGFVKIAQAQETGDDSPTLASLTFDVVGDNGATELPFEPAETLVNDEQGNAFDLELDAGSIEVGEEADCDQLGDVNGDGSVTAADATLTQRYIVGLDIDGPFYPECADVTQDGEVHSGDVVAILQEVVDF